VLVPDKPAWRYGVSGSSWFFYPGSHAILQRQQGDWNQAIDAAFQSIDQRLARRRAA